MAETFLEAGKKLVEREVIATQTQNTLIIDDGTNEAGIPGFPYKFKAQGDKILVSVDIYKSGYECKDCKGSGRIKSRCPCEETDRPGYKYDNAQIHEAGMSLGEVAYQSRKAMKCTSCLGDFETHRVNIECLLCKGTGASLIIPDQAKTLPTTGVIVSIGRNTLRRQQLRKFAYNLLPKFLQTRLSYLIEDDLSLQSRVLFGAYTGVMIPTRAPGIVFKVLRDIEVLCIIKGGENLAAFDFVSIDKDL